MNSLNIKSSITIMIISLLFACSDKFDPIPFSGNLDLPTEYTYELTIACYCTQNYVGPHRIHIKDDELIDYEIDVDGVMLDDQTDLKQFTIDALVERVDDILARDPYSQEIKMHPDHNFPISVYFDIDQRVADEEWGYEITNFKVVID